MTAHLNMKVWAQVAAIVVVVTGGFTLLEVPERHLEALMISGFLDLLGTHAVATVEGSQMLVVAHRPPAFWADITPACSGLPSLLAMLSLGWTLPRRSGGHPKALAMAVAGSVVYAANLVRIGASVLVGVYFGDTSLVLFHNWVGSIMGFAGALAGFILMLWLMLPPDGSSAGVPTGTPAATG